MENSCKFYSRLPGFRLVYGGDNYSFTTFELGEEEVKMCLNLEFTSDDVSPSAGGAGKRRDFGRVIFHTKNVDDLYQYMKSDNAISDVITFENEPVYAPWGERFFHVRDPDGYQLSFAQPRLSRGIQRESGEHT
jgi:catechol 2,3-dioxygenase-like lactoylglutathione lyase family enzyme